MVDTSRVEFRLRNAMKPEEIEAYIDAAAAALELPLAPAHRPGVLQYFSLAASMAELVEGLRLGVEHEAAPQFVPIEANTNRRGLAR